MNGHFIETVDRGILHYTLPGFPKLSVRFMGKVSEPVQGKVSTIGSAHGARIDIVDADYTLAEDPQDRPDGFVTRLRKTKLVAKVADCATILLVHERSSAIGLAHAGWRGTRAGVVQNLVKKMKMNVDASEIQALVTPYADGARYYVCVQDVPGWINMYTEFQRVFSQPVLDVIFVPHETDKRKAYLDIGLAIQYALMTSGVLEQNITISEHRTISESMFWSSRLQIPPEDRTAGKPRLHISHNTMCVSLK